MKSRSETTRLRNNETAKERKSDAKQRKGYAKQQKDAKQQKRCETTKLQNNERVKGRGDRIRTPLTQKIIKHHTKEIYMNMKECFKDDN